ncbi:MAG: hypothetical protein QM785_11535 [Pyrinomonadaceae bacterium]
MATPTSSVKTLLKKLASSKKKGCFLVVFAVAVVALIPVYGVLYPPLSDLVQHVLVNKLLWEKIAGVSNLDLEVSGYLGYRLLSVLIVVLISACKLFGIPLVSRYFFLAVSKIEEPAIF